MCVFWSWIAMVNRLKDIVLRVLKNIFSLIGAPRLLQSVAKDDIIPILKPFQSTFRNEPFRALIFTLILSEISVLVANLDVVTSKFSRLNEREKKQIHLAIVSEFFLMCYLSVNFVCILQTLLRMIIFSIVFPLSSIHP